MKGKFTIGKLDSVVWDNHIMDQGIKKMLRILADATEINKLFLFISVGTDNSDSEVRNLTALKAEVGSKFSIGSHAINSVFPFDLELNIVIPADVITAGIILKEVGIWFGPSGTEFLFARATDSTGVTVVASQAVPVKYNLNIL